MNLTTEQLTDVFKLARGIYDTPPLDVTRMDTATIVVKQGYALYSLSIFESINSDVRIEGGFAIKLEQSFIKDNYVVSEQGMNIEQSWYNDPKLIVPENINLIVDYLSRATLKPKPHETL